MSWEDCPCCGAATFPDDSKQWDGARVPCGCDCWVSVDTSDEEPTGHISMGDGPCPKCTTGSIWLDGPDSEAARAARGEPDPDHTPAVRRVVAWVPASDSACEILESPKDAYDMEAAHRIEVCLNARGDCYWTWRECVGDERAMEVQDRWASLLRRRDEKAGFLFFPCAAF